MNTFKIQIAIIEIPKILFKRENFKKIKILIAEMSKIKILDILIMFGLFGSDTMSSNIFFFDLYYYFPWFFSFLNHTYTLLKFF